MQSVLHQSYPGRDLRVLQADVPRSSCWLDIFDDARK